MVWDEGYATEAAKAMIQWAYQNLGARDFIARHANANKASGNVIIKCGFQFEKYGQYSRYDGSEIFEASYYTLHFEWRLRTFAEEWHEEAKYDSADIEPYAFENFVLAFLVEWDGYGKYGVTKEMDDREKCEEYLKIPLEYLFEHYKKW